MTASAAPELARPDDQTPAAAIGKAFALYDALRAACPAMRLSELSRSTGLPKSTTHRLLGELIAAGVVVRFGIGYAAAERSRSTVSRLGNHGHDRSRPELLRRLAPYAGDAMARTRLTSSLAVLDGADVVFAHRVYGHDNPRTASDDSGRAAAHSTAAGRMLLSHDPRAVCDLAETWGLTAGEATAMQSELLRIRRRQFAIAEVDGISCLAVALPLGPGRPPVVLTAKAKSLADCGQTVLWLRRIAEAAARSAIGARVDDRGNETLAATS
ncbi:helix-turn-helix domain-containing protein [Streptomyces sp. SID13031]|uniref:IclR family transcriptional regulator n=1 Tax=Streptomyces sp. SID13031 TaxID=2706046 RepID=UPI0013CC8762|nr:helix-turn-helix domain-containing protein [Streptomyces sp. SID13031]NEA31172.1 helix-turn-helix domain-containing protein [Streptomyces sp. SID13031]